MSEEFDLERRDYDSKIKEIKKQKRKLRDLQDAATVKKIKKDLKIEQRSAKHSDNNNVKMYLREEIQKFSSKNNEDENAQ